MEKKENTLSRGYPVKANVVGGVYFSMQRCDEYTESDVSSTLSARDYKSATDLILVLNDQGGALLK